MRPLSPTYGFGVREARGVRPSLKLLLYGLGVRPAGLLYGFGVRPQRAPLGVLGGPIEPGAAKPPSSGSSLPPGLATNRQINRQTEDSIELGTYFRRRSLSFSMEITFALVINSILAIGPFVSLIVAA